MKSLKWVRRVVRQFLRPLRSPSPGGTRKEFLARADLARDKADWPTAARFYSAALSVAPHDRAVLIQYGHALKESGRREEAAGAYKAAVLADENDLDGWMQLGHIRKLQGRDADALDCYAEALRRNPTYKPARAELLAAGARDRLTLANYGLSPTTAALANISSTLKRNLESIEELLVVSTYPVEAYSSFRKDHSIMGPVPAAVTPSVRITWIIDARNQPPSQARRTINSLIEQKITTWTAYVIATAAMLEHTVSSMAEIDPRVIFVSNTETIVAPGHTITIEAGIVLDCQTLPWFQYVVSRAPEAAAYTDHDYYLTHWRTGVTQLAPALQPSPDRHDFETTPAPAVAILLPPSQTFDLLRSLTGATSAHRQALSLAYEKRLPIAHIPRILASMPAQELSISASGPPSAPTMPARAGADDATILVVIPTRNHRSLLEKCINTLSGKATKNCMIKIVVVDNNSDDKDTIDYIDRKSRINEIRVVESKSAFNWSRLNNAAASSTTYGDILLFVNNDVELLTDGWDNVVRERLALPDVGVVGARLLYPDGTLQHAGIALGGEDNRPHHEGAGSAVGSGGPSDRWLRRRQAAAVTGAFLAVRRADFEAAGGFDEKLAIGYNDIDFCLRVRERGLAVIYEPGIEAIHHESKSRGLNNTAEKVAWDDAELEDLYRKWGDIVFRDPSINPQWVCGRARSFEGFRDLSVRQVSNWIDYCLERTCRP